MLLFITFIARYDSSNGKKGTDDNVDNEYDNDTGNEDD